MTDNTGNSKNRRRPGVAATVVVALMAAALLAGCGKKGNPQPPADEPNTYPKAYPRE